MSEKHNPYEAKDTGHVWDEDLRELENPPPRWWMIGLHLSWISVVVYCILFPSIPLVNGATEGILGWTQVKRLNKNLAEVEAKKAPFREKIAAMTAAEVLASPELSNFAQRSARVTFGDYCAPCHGSGGQGGPGFPVIADDDWLYGGAVDTIAETIRAGRQGNMPAHRNLLSAAEVDDVVKYVAGLSKGLPHEPGRAVFLGQTEGAAMCAVCHGEDGKGNADTGGPNLTDGIWRFDGSEAGIRQTVLHGVNDGEDAETRKAIMPEFGRKLSETQIKELAVFVHQLGGGQ